MSHPNCVNDPDHKMHVLLREYSELQYEILFETWTPELGWRRVQFLVTPDQLARIQLALTE